MLRSSAALLVTATAADAFAGTSSFLPSASGGPPLPPQIVAESRFSRPREFFVTRSNVAWCPLVAFHGESMHGDSWICIPVGGRAKAMLSAHKTDRTAAKAAPLGLKMEDPLVSASIIT